MNNRIPHLRDWVIKKDLTNLSEEQSALEHGTAVCGAVLYGPIDINRIAQPIFKVKSFRVFPIPPVHGADLDLYQVLDWIIDQVEAPENRHIKIYVLSFGPDHPVDDMDINLFTVTLDQLAYDHNVLFIVAAGNRGQENEPFNRIQPPSDIVNGLGIGAYIYDGGGVPIPTNYSCVGPGRPGSQIKPDICAFGGSPEQPFYVLLSGTNGEVTDECGTSFAAPLVGATAGHLLYRVSDPETITPQTAKALLVHHASRGRIGTLNMAGEH